jgi:hypothetical protein
LLSGDTRESGVKGASASLAWGSCSVAGFSSTAGGGPGALCVTVPLLDSSGVMGRADGRLTLRERDRRWGMAGTMRESGRRACLCAAGAVSATMGAMVVVMVGESAGKRGDGGSGSRYQQPRFLPIVLERPGTRETAEARGWGIVGGNSRSCNGDFRSLADNCGDEAMTHVDVSQRRGERRGDLSHLCIHTHLTYFFSCASRYEGGVKGLLSRSECQPQLLCQMSCKLSPAISRQLHRREPAIKVEHTQPKMNPQQEALACKYNEIGFSGERETI